MTKFTRMSDPYLVGQFIKSNAHEYENSNNQSGLRSPVDLNEFQPIRLECEYWSRSIRRGLLVALLGRRCTEMQGVIRLSLVFYFKFKRN